MKVARVTSGILKKDMKTLNDSPRPSDKEVNAAVTEGVKRSLAIGDGTSPSSVIRVNHFLLR